MARHETAILIRPATQDDLDILWRFLAIAAYEPNIGAAKAVPFVAAHLAGCRRGVGLCLNVRHDNPARRLYERLGFRLVPGSGVPNRVGGTSLGMMWRAPR